MKHLGTITVASLVVLGVAACSAGSPVGVGGPAGTGAATASGGKGGSVGVGGTSGGGKGGGTTGGSTTGGSSSGGTGTGGTSAGGTGGGGSGSGGSAGVIGSNLDCTDAQLGSPALRLLTRRELENTLNDIFPSVKGQWTDTLSANSSTYYGFDNDAGAAVTNQMVSALFDTSLSVATAVTGSGLSTLLPCAATGDHACAKTFLDQFGRRLFRRPMTDGEEARYLALFDSGLAISDFSTALKWVIAGVIQSPYAVYRSEIGTPMGNARQLDPYEVATELGYTFGGSTPDTTLLDEAAAGPIADPAAEAKRLLQTPAGQDVVQHFFEAYLAYTGGSAAVRTLADPAPTTGLDYVDVAPDMLAETRAFIADVVINQRLGLMDLLTSPQTYPSQKLAQYYGFPTPTADGAAVTRPSGHGVGVLAQGAFLSSHANVDASSPTQRGLFAYYRLMCQPKLSPPASVPPLSASAAANTTRERYEKSHASGGCAGCHQLFDPIGFGFENFDQGGRFRTTQNGYPVNPAASAVDMDGNTLFSFNDEEDLAAALAKQDESYQCLSAYLSTYAFGSAASCLGPTLTSNTGSILDAYANLATVVNFAQRNAQ